MHITFFGAVREVTGSMHLMTTGTDRILLDCGMYQGKRKEADRKNRVLPIDPAMLTNMVLSHAHIDHCGRIPLLMKHNFNGRVICTRATTDACSYLLMDSAKIQESDADYLNYKRLRSILMKLRTTGTKRKGDKQRLRDIKKMLKKERHELNSETINSLADEHGLERIEPLYNMEEARQSLSFFDGYPYRNPVTIGKNVTCTLYDAGHILGSAISILRASKNGREYTVGFTGDIGRFGRPILRDPASNFEKPDRDIDLMIMESTYGDRLHEPVQDLKPSLAKVLNEAASLGGAILIPSFAFGRTQELLYVLHEIYDEKLAPRLPVFVDSPLATQITKVFGEHPELYDMDTHETFLEKGKNPFRFDQIRFVRDVEESMWLNRQETPHVVISASGMCEGGRILHHLRHKIHNEKTTILIVGYMAQNTLGRKLLDYGLEYEQAGRKGPAPLIKFLGKQYPLKARVVKLGGFSAHGDKTEMTRWLKNSNLRIKRIAVVHGEEDQSTAFAKHLNGEGFETFVPRYGETVNVDS